MQAEVMRNERGCEMPSTFGTAFGVIGPALTCFGAVVQFIDWRKSRVENKKIADVREHIDALDEIVDDLRKKDKTRGRGSIQGVDIGEAFDILQKGVELANKNSRKYLREYTDEVDRASARREKYVRLSVLLIVAGTIMWATASFI